ncbi:hypothetical protein [Desulfogranum mediterraneum]|uniref:hypothetical protein n=1 Tax=Desulfogranum mediterraneum TaxID=160661 RepID=UPI00048ED52C|nr:hypothetical protein [Desulfogranum mediterraneum]
MEETVFFKRIWRFNALVISLAGVLAILVLLFAGYHLLQDLFRSRQVGNIVNLAEEEGVEEEWTLGKIRTVVGSGHLMVPLESDQSYAQSYYSKSTTSYRNILFIDLQSSEKSWLLPENNWLILSSQVAPEDDYREQQRKARVIIYTIVKSDTNRDERLSSRDKLTIALSAPSGRSYTEILPSIDRLIGYALAGADGLLILYEKNKVAYSARVSLHDFTLLTNEALPRVR